MRDRSSSAFSIRRLNPFNGTLQAYTTANARALSSNGVIWEIQVLSDKPQGLWANTPFAGQQFYTFGVWSLVDGLGQVPLNPLFNTSGMLDSAQQLIACLETRLDQLPFPLTDAYELWLLDEASHAPIALLDSARSETELAQKESRHWQAAEPGEFGFVSPTLSQQGLPVNDGYNPRVHASMIEALVRERGGGQYPQRAWYLRHENKSGTAIQHAAHELPANAFPELPVSLDWQDTQDHQLIMDYINWKAPQILLLPNLSAVARDMIEKLAVKNATQIERLWRLFPEIHNKTLLNKARVEARIRLSNQH